MKPVKSTTLYAHPFCRGYWRDAAAELRDLRMMVFAALIVALRIAMKTLEIPIIPGQLYISIGFFINALGSMIYGPVVAVLGAAVSDTLGFLVNSKGGAYFFPFIFTEIAGSLIFALFLYRSKITATRVILSRFCVNFFVNIILQAPIMWLYYKMVLGKSYVLFQLPQIIKNLALFPLEAMLLILFLTALVPLIFRLHLIYDGEALQLRKRQIVLLVILTVIGAACVTGYFFYDYNTANHASRLAPDTVVEMNTSITGDAQAKGLLEEGQIAVVNKVYKKWKGDTTVEFNVYATSEGTDLSKAEGYLNKNAKKDESLTLAASGSAVLALGDPGDISAVSVTPAG